MRARIIIFGDGLQGLDPRLGYTNPYGYPEPGLSIVITNHYGIGGQTLWVVPIDCPPGDYPFTVVGCARAFLLASREEILGTRNFGLQYFTMMKNYTSPTSAWLTQQLFGV